MGQRAAKIKKMHPYSEEATVRCRRQTGEWNTASWMLKSRFSRTSGAEEGSNQLHRKGKDIPRMAGFSWVLEFSQLGRENSGDGKSMKSHVLEPLVLCSGACDIGSMD